MKNIIKKVSNLKKESKVWIITIASLITVVICIALIILIGRRIDKTLSSSDNLDTNKQQVVASEVNDRDITPSEVITSEVESETASEVESNGIDETSDTSIDKQVQVEKAPINDEGDPQNNGGSGISMDISSVSKEDKKNERMTYGIDVSKWQGVIDWKKVKETGVDFAMIRVGYRTLDKGIIVEDPYALYNMQQAQANGIKIGVYFFSTATNEAEVIEEARWLTDFIAPYRITYPVAFNCEGFTNPSNRQYGLSKEERTSLAVTFLDYVRSKGYTPMFYAAKGELEGSLEWDTNRLASNYKIWVAHYPQSFSSSSKSSYSGTHHMWQYTSKGQVSGISNPVDLNIAYFGYDSEATAKSDEPVETVVADPNALSNQGEESTKSSPNIVNGQYFTNVNEQVTAKEVVNLRSVPSSESNDTIKGQLKNGEVATRTGIGDKGWSRLEIDGTSYYVITSFITTDLNYKVKETSANSDDNKNVENAKPSLDSPEAGMNFESVNEKVTAKELTNLRLIPSQASDDYIADQLTNGDIAIRTGIDRAKGWSRVTYKDKTLYAVTSYLQVVE